METSKYVKKKTLYLIFSIICIIMITVYTSYSVLNSDIKNVKYKTNSLQLLFEDSTTIKMLEYPVDVETGLFSSPVNKVKIINRTTEPVKYDLVIVLGSTNTIKYDSIYYAIDNNVQKLPKSGIVYSGTLDGEQSIYLDFKIWIDIDSIKESDYGSSFSIEMDVSEK